MDLPSTAARAGTRWLWAAVLLFLLQTLPWLSNRWVTDESWYAAPGYSIAQGHGIRDPAIGPNDLENRFDARPPGTALVIAAFFKVLGATAVAARLGSVLAGLGIVLLTWRLTHDMLGEEGAILATLLVATDNLIVLTSRTARPEALTTLMVLAAMLAIKRYSRDGRMLWAGLAGLLLAAGAMFHITLLGYIVSLFLLAMVVYTKPGRFPFAGAVALTAGFFAGLVPFAVWILTAPLGPAGFRAEFLKRAAGSSILAKFTREGRRYNDIVGLHTLHGHGLDALPVRIFIPLIFLYASYLLWKSRRSWFYLELVLLLPTLLWFVYTVNKSSRYLALASPVFAMAIGAAVAVTRPSRDQLSPGRHRIMLALAWIVVAAQFGGNLVLLKGARSARYSRVAEQLKAIVAPGETVYGTITFWLALHDHPFISYERTTPAMAVELDHAHYFILGDKMLVNPNLYGEGSFFEQVQRDLDRIAAQGRLVGEIHDPYYGDLTVYRYDGGSR